MKKLLLISLIFCFGFTQAPHLKRIARENSVGTDYTADANCMGAWFMNGGLGANGDDETDRSGEGETLTETSGDIPNSATVPTGYSGTSRDFTDGETENLEHADGGSTDINGANQSMSFCAWYRMENDTSDHQTLMNKGMSDANEHQFGIWYDDTNNNWRFEISNDGSTDVKCKGATGRTIGTWQHVCGVYNDTDIRVYIGGSLDSNGADNPIAHTDGIYNGSSAFDIGRTGAVDEADGLIDEVIIFDRALSAAEVLDIYNNGIDGTKGAND